MVGDYEYKYVLGCVQQYSVFFECNWAGERLVMLSPFLLPPPPRPLLLD